VSTTFEHWKIEKLKNHHLNAEVFGELSSDADCQDFVDSIKNQGVIEPAIITGDGTLISGHRRRQGAARAGLKELDVIVRRDLKDQESIDAAWFEANKQREMTNEQKARWVSKREPIFAALAKKRQKTGKSDLRANLPQGRAADAAASEVGMSRRTAETAKKVVEVIDQAEANGDKATAAKLRETLNGKSVSAAKREADKVIAPAKPKPSRNKKSGSGSSPAKTVDQLSKKHVGPLVRGIDEVAKINGGKGLAHVCANDALNDLIAALKRMRGGEQ
jgi:ParB-like chromosome segregation protein Spo0J